MASSTGLALAKLSAGGADHDGERAILSPLHAAGDRRIDEMPAGLGHGLGNGLDLAGRAGRHQDDGRAGSQRIERAGLEQDGAGLGGVDHHQDERLGLLRRCGGAVGAVSAGCHERGAGALPHVEAGDVELALDEILGHRRAHSAEPDEGDGSHND
jgi:hypothetical protein